MAKETLFGGDWQKVLIKVVLLLLVLLLIYGGIKKLLLLIKGNPDREDKEDILDEQESNPPIVIDDSQNSDPETITNNDALDIANKLEIAMDNWGTDLDLMFNLLACLNGASLQKVKFEFGIRDYDGDSDKPYDLFDWFAQELEAGLFAGGNIGVNSECVPECTSYWDMCGEAYFMRQIWVKSGFPITF